MGIILERLFGSVDGGRDGADGGHGGLQCFLVSFGKNNNDDIEGVAVVAVDGPTNAIVSHSSRSANRILNKSSLFNAWPLQSKHDLQAEPVKFQPLCRITQRQSTKLGNLKGHERPDPFLTLTTIGQYKKLNSQRQPECSPKPARRMNNNNLATSFTTNLHYGEKCPKEAMNYFQQTFLRL